MKFQCYICGEGIETKHELDPCEVNIESNCDQDPLDSKRQTFWCHFNCFQKQMNDSRVLELENGVGTEREIAEENANIIDKLKQISDRLYDSSDYLKRLFLNDKGVWYRLINIISTENTALTKEISYAEQCIFGKILVSWSYDSKNKEKLIVLTTEDYEHFASTRCKT